MRTAYSVAKVWTETSEATLTRGNREDLIESVTREGEVVTFNLFVAHEEKDTLILGVSNYRVHQDTLVNVQFLNHVGSHNTNVMRPGKTQRDKEFTGAHKRRLDNRRNRVGNGPAKGHNPAAAKYGKK